jgi:multidrug efflux pump subunit AcrA (membrane-fusion protein)
MKRWLKVLIPVVVLGGIGFGAVQASKSSGASKNGFTLVKVERGTITDKALATGQIVPEQEIQVKSQISGTIQECFAEVGDRVEIGQPLFSITPDPTPLELNEVERGVQLAEVAYARASADFERNGALWKEGILSKELFDASKQAFDQSRIQLDLTRERLALTKEGKLARAKGGMDSVIRAPASGTVLKRHVNPGDPVVPLTSYQAGTPLMTLADMGTLMFKGTVDEIDVGKLKEAAHEDRPQGDREGGHDAVRRRGGHREPRWRDAARRLLGERRRRHPGEGQRPAAPRAARELREGQGFRRGPWRRAGRAAGEEGDQGRVVRWLETRDRGRSCGGRGDCPAPPEGDQVTLRRVDALKGHPERSGGSHRETTTSIRSAGSPEARG